jgi:hypothetical protein
MGKDELDSIVEELVECNQIDDYWIQAFLASLSRSDLQSIVRLLQRRVAHAESFDESDDYPSGPVSLARQVAIGVTRHAGPPAHSGGAAGLGVLMARFPVDLRMAEVKRPWNLSVSQSYARELTSHWCGRTPMALGLP